MQQEAWEAFVARSDAFEVDADGPLGDGGHGVCARVRDRNRHRRPVHVDAAVLGYA